MPAPPATTPPCAPTAGASRCRAEREAGLTAALGSLRSATPARVTSEIAVTTSRERRLDRVYAFALAAALAAVVWLVGARVRGGDPAGPPVAVQTVEEAFLLRCLWPEEAMSLARPLLRSRSASLTATPSAPRVITVRATAAQLEEVRGMLARYDGPASPACAPRPERITTPRAPAP